MSHLNRLREIRAALCSEQDPVKRQEILDCLLSLIEERWRQLLGLVAEEHDPAELRSMIRELSTILSERRKGPLQKAATASAASGTTEPGYLSSKDNGL